MAHGYLLGLDKGTSVVKAVLFDLQGREVAVAGQPAPAVYPQSGWHEEDLHGTWDITCSVARQVMQNTGINPDAIQAVGLSGHMSGLILVDGRGQPVGNAVIWSDGRASGIVRRWETEGLLERMFAISGQAVIPGLTLPLMRWFHEHRPQDLARAAHVLTMKDYLRLRMVGEAATEESDVAWMMGDVQQRRFSPELLSLAGLSSYERLYPPVRPYGSVAGGLREAAAQEMGLRPGTPVVYGLGDATAATIGVGAVRSGQACSIVGTSFLNNLVTAELAWEPFGIGFVFPMTDGLWLRLLPNTGGGSVNLRWFVEMFYPGETGRDAYKRLDQEAASVPVGANGVIYHPYVTTAGVVAPFYSIGARAQFFGVSIQSTRRDMARAVFEGIALSMRDCYVGAGQPLEEIRLSGGAAQSPVLCQIFADCTGATITVPVGTEASAKGVAMLAGMAAGIYGSVPEAAGQMVAVDRVYTPRPEQTRRYDEIYPLFRNIREQMMGPWEMRTRLFQAE